MSFADGLTLLRLLLVPFILACFVGGYYRAAFILFVIAGVTDLVDGFIARLLRRQTRFGAVLDPIADKALMVTTIACLLILKVVPLWFFLLLALRDGAILGGLAWFKIRKIKIELKPLWSSKLATLVNLVTVIFGFTLVLGYPLKLWFHLSLAASTVLILLSAVQYGRVGLQIIRERIFHGTSTL